MTSIIAAHYNFHYERAQKKAHRYPIFCGNFLPAYDFFLILGYMNTKRILFWSAFVIVLGLIIWGLIVAMNKGQAPPNLGTPALVTPVDNIIGDPNAPVTIIEYSDFQCPACEGYYPLVAKLLIDASSTVRLVYRNFPLPQHANAMAAAIAAEAAADQGKFKDMYDLLFGNHTDWTELADPEPVFDSYATKIGLDMSKFKADVADPATQAKITADIAEGNGLGIDSTPTFFVNGKVIQNPSSYDEFKSLIQSAASSSQN